MPIPATIETIVFILNGYRACIYVMMNKTGLEDDVCQNLHALRAITGRYILTLRLMKEANVTLSIPCVDIYIPKRVRVIACSLFILNK